MKLNRDKLLSMLFYPRYLTIDPVRKTENDSEYGYVDPDRLALKIPNPFMLKLFSEGVAG